jgi:hypothetical protein
MLLCGQPLLECREVNWVGAKKVKWDSSKYRDMMCNDYYHCKRVTASRVYNGVV